MKAKVYLYNTKRKDKQLKNKSNMEAKRTDSERINWEERNFQLAKAAMQGFIASGKFPYTEEDGFEKLATYSIEMADEMVTQLKEYDRHSHTNNGKEG